MFKRHQSRLVFSEEYKNKMRFIAGPRQSGKTTLVQAFLRGLHLSDLYFNWDRREVRSRYYQNSYFYHDELLASPSAGRKWAAFDEIHKLPRWKNILKDLYDTDKERVNFIITGSARLDMFRKAGDSLTGRYYLFHLLPMTLKELLKAPSVAEGPLPAAALDFVEKQLSRVNYHPDELGRLLKFSGFPEPLLAAKEKLHRMWQNNYLDTVLNEDLRDLTGVRNLEAVANLTALLPPRIGSPLSVNSLSRDMALSYPAIKNYLHLLELGYLLFKIPPYSQRIARSLKKEQKYYFFDWTRVPDSAARFENYVAVELYNMTTLLTEHGLGNFQLYYVRNRAGQETDFLLTVDERPWLLFEVKLQDEGVAAHHFHQARVLGDIPFVQLTYKDRVSKKIGDKHYVISASRFFA